MASATSTTIAGNNTGQLQRDRVRVLTESLFGIWDFFLTTRPSGRLSVDPQSCQQLIYSTPENDMAKKSFNWLRILGRPSHIPKYGLSGSMVHVSDGNLLTQTKLSIIRNSTLVKNVYRYCQDFSCKEYTSLC